jgi:hypothetical protein
LRGQGAPFVMQGELVQNQIRIKIQNRGSEARSYTIVLSRVEGARLIAPENPLSVPAGSQRETSVFVLAPKSAFSAGIREMSFSITDGSGATQRASYRLLGPMGAP